MGHVLVLYFEGPTAPCRCEGFLPYKAGWAIYPHLALHFEPILKRMLKEYDGVLLGYDHYATERLMRTMKRLIKRGISRRGIITDPEKFVRSILEKLLVSEELHYLRWCCECCLAGKNWRRIIGTYKDFIVGEEIVHWENPNRSIAAICGTKRKRLSKEFIFREPKKLKQEKIKELVLRNDV